MAQLKDTVISGDLRVTGTTYSSKINIPTDATIANGDKLLIRDVSDSDSIRSSTITFGTGTTTFLRNDGTWNAPTSLSYSGGQGAISASVSVGSSNTYLQYHNDNPGTTSSITLTASSIALSSTHVTVPTPTSDTDAATKKYVEDYVDSLDGTNISY